MNEERFKFYVLEIAKLDEHHHNLAEGLDKVRRELMVHDYINARSEMANLLLDLQHHYNYEEKLMLGIGYPYLESHAFEHKRLLEVAQKVKIDANSLKLLVLSELEEIIYKHTDTYDRQLADYINEENNDTK